MGLPPGEITLYAVTLLLFAYGIIFLWLSTRTGGSTQEKKDNKLLGVRVLFLGLALLYIGFSQFTLYAVLVTQIDTGLTPPCEYLSNTSTINGNVTTYTFINSCAGTPVGGGLVGILDAYGWLLWLNATILFFGSFFVGVLSFTRQMRRM